MELAAISGVAIALMIIMVIFVVKSLIIICPPNRVAIISGRTKQTADGRTVGYRAVKGGRTLRVPLLEQVSWMDLNNIPLEVSVMNAYSKGAIPLNVQGIANVKVSSNDSLLSNSVERFLNVPHQSIAQIAKETLEANLRGVLATLTPEEVNEDRLKFSQFLIEEADDDIKTLGLQLDVLKIQNVTDEVGYLDAVGRRRTADVLKSARVAEAEKQSEAEQAEAESQQRAHIARAKADRQVVEEQNLLRVRTAELDGVARASEEEARVAGEKARAIAEQELETERIELEKRRLQADVVLPAQADDLLQPHAGRHRHRRNRAQLDRGDRVEPSPLLEGQVANAGLRELRKVRVDHRTHGDHAPFHSLAKHHVQRRDVVANGRGPDGLEAIGDESIDILLLDR